MTAPAARKLQLAALALLLAIFAAGPARAEPDVADLLGRAGSALRAADYRTAESLAASALAMPSSRRQDRAEGWRIRGVALFFLGDVAAAEHAFVTYLKLDPEGHLDPVRVPPACIVFFEDVRARHAGEIAQSRPPPKTYFLLNFVPPGGQIQNGDTAKAWLIGSAEVALLSANLATFFILRSWCEQGRGSTCDAGGQRPERAQSARTLQGINIATGAGFAAIYLYGVIDGIINGDRPRDRQPAVTLGLGNDFAPTLTWTF